MNERIRKLLVEFKEVESQHRGLEVIIGMDEIEKFAELIVRECYGEVLCQLYDYNPSSNEQFNLGHETGLKLAVTKIKEHFGVEE